ncbi:MAG TPA: DUF5916 domain-containing protein [Gemmatimonadales bacterium]|nr:DUF5916 domain-containing protein [Gemmatimonadales bacterium]
MSSSANILALVASLSAPALSQSSPESRVPSPEPLAVPDAAGPITLDGRLDEPAWAHAVWITQFFESWPGDDVPPPVRTAVAITYDARFLYLGLDAQDPDPRRVHAVYTDRDNVASPDDYVGFLIDTRGDGRSAALLRISPRGVQADGVFNEAQFALGNPDDLTPDFTWDARVAVGDSGWTAELKIPFSSLRYPRRERQTWGLIVHRVYPRDFVHSIFSVPLPRGTNCFLCHEQRLELVGLPSGGSLLAVPYTTARADRTTRWADGPTALRAGADVKWTPGANTALDLTVRPDFSQIESDATQLGVNTQFALFYPEKRPFFLEGSDLFQTPLQAVYTRSITAPDWGARATGELGSTAYTALVTRDRGGGSVIVPGPTESSLVPQDFTSVSGVVRSRTPLSRGFIGLLGTDREIAHDGGGGYNRVVGPDVQWRATNADLLSAQLVASDTRVPVRPDLEPTWDGRRLTSGALDATWHHMDRHLEWFAQYRDVGAGFRADNGFTPQVGVRVSNGWADVNFHRPGAINWVSPWAQWQRVVDRGGAVVSDYRGVAIQLGGVRGLYLQLRYSDEQLRALDSLLRRRYSWVYVEAAPSRRLASVTLFARAGGDVDVVNARGGTGAEVKSTFLIRATDHFELQGSEDLSRLDIPIAGVTSRLFTARVERVRARYNFTPRAALRLIVQNVRIRRDPALYSTPVPAAEGALTFSALLSYRWSWATAAYLGWGDDRELDAGGAFAPGREQLFLKLQVGY